MPAVTVVDIAKVNDPIEIFRKVVIDWVSDASGVISVITDKLQGTLVRVVIKPDAIDAPTANYVLTIRDEQGVDVLANQGAALSAVNTLNICPGFNFTDGTTVSMAPFMISDVLTVAGTGAGNTKKGKIALYFRMH